MNSQKNNFRWGILGAGRIANDFAECLALLPNAEILAVASSSEERAKEFSSKHNSNKYYTNYEELAEDPEVDAIYVATTHNFHYDHVLLCLEMGKHVLCEKPMTTNSSESEKLIKLAREKDVFLMEAMWTRFLPLWVNVKRWIEEDLIGELIMIKADFGFFTRHGDFGRHLNPELAGGALLDVGIYPLSLACWLFGSIPEKSHSNAYLTEKGVDGVSSYYLDFGKGKSALLSSSVIVHTPKDAVIVGTKGYIKVPDFWKAQKVSVYVNGKDEQHNNFPYESFGFQFEAKEAMECIIRGELESRVMPLDETQKIIKLMDSFRNSWNLKYPWETA
jgi:predicted dehydrogenase